MNFEIAKKKFINSWGELCHNWGVNRAMGHIHAVLLISPTPLCADEIMNELQFSRGNVHLNIKNLIEWDLIKKINISGCRKDYYQAVKDFNEIFKVIISHRKKKEFDPLVLLINELGNVEPECKSSIELCKVIQGMESYTRRIERVFKSLTEGTLDWLAKII